MLSVVFLVHTERADQVEVRQRIMLIDFFACFHVIIYLERRRFRKITISSEAAGISHCSL